MLVVLKDIKKNINYYLFIFFLFAIGGWFCEIIWSLIFNHKLVNPGCLIGPWCPIYGTAVVFIVLLTRKKRNILFNSIKISIISALIEYISAFISEDFFDNQIWDYSNRFLNIDGRVCLSMTLVFTISGLIFIYLIEPFVNEIYFKYKNVIKYSNIIVTISFIANIILKIII